MPSPRSSLSQQSHRKCHTCRVWRSCIVTLFTYLFNKTSECLPACDPQLRLLVRNTVYSRQTDGKLWKNPNAHVRGCYWTSAILVSKCLGVCESVCVSYHDGEPPVLSCCSLMFRMSPSGKGVANRNKSTAPLSKTRLSGSARV